MYNVEIIGTGSFVPEHKVTNDDLAKIVDTSDEWISQMTGIKERRITIKEGTTDMAVNAAKLALEDAGVAASEIELIIVGTVTADYYFPSTACLVQAALGATGATSFDIGAGCTGFIYALSVANQFIRTGMYKTALVISAEVLSKITDWTDRSTCVLFADGAGAAVVRRSEEEGIINIYTGAEGDYQEYLACVAAPLGNYFMEVQKTEPKQTYMNGKEVYKFAVKSIPECVLKVLEGTGYTLDDIKWFIPHQANTRIIDVAAKKLGIAIEKFHLILHKYGNTSGASIPIALDEMARTGLLEPGDLFIIVGFGAGFTYGAQLVRWTKAKA